MLYKFDKESLLFKRSYEVIKYKIVLSLILICFGATLVSAISATKEKNKLKREIVEKENRLKFIKLPLREDSYVEDVIESIGYNFNNKQKNNIEVFIKKHRTKIEEAKVPITAVVWIAFNESEFNSKAKNPNSSACGMFGFIDSTWKDMCKLKGVSYTNRFDENKQVIILLTYLNYLYNKTQNWEKVMRSYQGQRQLYPTKFLFK